MTAASSGTEDGGRDPRRSGTTHGLPRSFHALNVAQLLGAFNDNLFKGVILALVGLDSARHLLPEHVAFEVWGLDPKTVVGLAFSLPFVVVGSFAGVLADRFPKPRSIRLLKLTETGLMAGGALAFWAGSSWALLVLLLLMALQSAFFGPNKYGVLPEVLSERDLQRGNAVVQATTYAAIILGIWLSGELLAGLGTAHWWIGVGCVGVASVGWIAARRMDDLPAARDDLALLEPPLRSLRRSLGVVAQDRELGIALGLGAIFLHVAGVLLLSIVDYGNLLELAPDETSRLNGVLAVGIALGSWLCGRLSRGGMRPGLAPIGAAGVAAGLALCALPITSAPLLALCLILAGAGAGFFVVPVRAVLQERPPRGSTGQVLGLAQVVDFTALLLASVVYEVLAVGLGLGARGQFAAIAVLTALGAGVLFAASRLYLPSRRPS